MELLSTFHFNPWWAALVIAAFGSVISFFQINSAWADKSKWNGKIAVVGAFLAVAAIFFLVKVIQTSN